MRRASIRSAWLVLAITLVAGSAAGHIAPSVDDNNRYLKLTPAADRVRIAYTVFFGEVPGAQTRKTIDHDRDGQISDAEAQAFATKIAGEVGSSLDLTVDGARHAVTWSTVVAGMGSPQTVAGAFSVDLVAWVCLSTVRGRHTVLLRDRFRIPRPGETEVKVEDSPGVTIDHARIGPANDPTHDFRFVGPGGPLTDDGLELQFTASDKAPLTADATCTGRPAGTPRPPTTMIVGLAAGVAFLLAVVVAVVRARRKRLARSA
jgi:hypothetical protein